MPWNVGAKFYHGILTLEKVGTAVNYHGIFITLAKNTMVFFKHWPKIPWYFYNTGQKYHGILTLEKGGIFITLAPGDSVIKIQQ